MTGDAMFLIMFCVARCGENRLINPRNLLNRVAHNAAVLSQRLCQCSEGSAAAARSYSRRTASSLGVTLSRVLAECYIAAYWLCAVQRPTGTAAKQNPFKATPIVVF